MGVERQMHGAALMRGRRYARVVVDPRDNSPDDGGKTAPDGQGEYAVTFYVPGLLERADSVGLARDEIGKAIARHGTGQTCGLFHDRDVQPHDLPHTGRVEINLFLRRTTKRYRRPVVLVQVWTHIGDCETARQR